MGDIRGTIDEEQDDLQGLQRELYSTQNPPNLYGDVDFNDLFGSLPDAQSLSPTQLHATLPPEPQHTNDSYRSNATGDGDGDDSINCNFFSPYNAYQTPQFSPLTVAPDCNDDQALYQCNLPYVKEENVKNPYLKTEPMSPRQDYIPQKRDNKIKVLLKNIESRVESGIFERQENAVIISKLVAETENFAIRLLQSSLDENITHLTKIKDQLLTYANLPIDNNIESDIMHLISNCNKFNENLIPFNLFYNDKVNGKDVRKKFKINSLNYGLMICLLHLKYLKNIGNFSHRLRITMEDIVFKRFSFYMIDAEVENKVPFNKVATMTRAKKCIETICRAMAEKFNLRRNIIIFIQKNNYKKFMLQTHEQYDAATINYMKRFIQNKYPEPLYGYKFKLNNNSWFLPLSLFTIPVMTFNCSNTLDSLDNTECDRFYDFPYNHKLNDDTYIMSIQSMFACSLVDITNIKNCNTMMTKNYTKTIPDITINEAIKHGIENGHFVNAISQQSMIEHEDLFMPEMTSLSYTIKPFFNVFQHATDVSIATMDLKYSMRVLLKFFIKIESLKFKQTTSTDAAGSEFYDIYFSTNISCKKPLVEMFSHRNVQAHVQDDKFCQMDGDEVFKLLRQRQTVRTEVDSRFEFIKYMEVMNPIFNREQENIDAQLARMSKNKSADWLTLADAIRIILLDEHQYSMDFIVVMYYFYCSQYNLTPKVSKTRLVQSCNAISILHKDFKVAKYVRLLEMFFQNADIDINNICEDDSDDCLNEMIKEILYLMINNGHITFVIGLLLRTDVVNEKKKLQRCITYCMDLMGDSITSYQKYIFLTMMAITESDGDENISLSIKCCFFPNIIIYFLCDYHYDTDFMKRVKYFVEFMEGRFKKFFTKNTPKGARKVVFDDDDENDSVDECLDGNDNTFDDEQNDEEDAMGNELVLPSFNHTRKRKKKNPSAPKKKRKQQPKNKQRKKYDKLSDLASDLDPDLRDFISIYIGFCFKKSAIIYAYDKFFYRDISELNVDDYTFGVETTIVEPSHNAYWYRRRPGIYNSFTRAFEKHSPALFGSISLQNPVWTPKDYDFNPFDYDLKNKLFDTTLKAIHFLRVCGYNRLMAVLLGPVQDPSQLTGPLADFYQIKSIKILYSDLYSTKDFLPDEYYSLVNSKYPKLNRAIMWLYLMVCELSKTLPDVQYLFSHPGIFLSQMFMGIDSDIYGEDRPDADSAKLDLNANIIDNPLTERNIASQYQEIDKIWSIPLEESMRNSTQPNARVSENIDESELTTTTIKLYSSKNKYYDVQIFDQVIRRKPNELTISNSRKLWNDIEINGGQTIKMFLLQIISWFIRMDVHHPYSNSRFFEFINENRFVSIF